MKKIVIVGATLTGNKGAAGMVLSLVKNLTTRYPDAKFTLISYYPKQDKKINHYSNLQIISGTPLALILHFLLLPLAFFLKILRIPIGPLKMHPILKSVDECDIFLDASGISFVDGREKFLPFNILCILSPLVLKKTTAKVPQALGPFKNPINRFCAKHILPQINLIGARGGKTVEFLQEIGLKNFKQYPDITFTLPLDDVCTEIIKRNTFAKKEKAVVGISPSQVVYKNCMNKNANYPLIFAAFIDRLVTNRYDVVLIPHSVRKGTQKTHNNDLPVLEKIFSHICNKEEVFQIRDELTPSELRVLIGQLDLFIASRFHAFISALCMEVPTLVFGWSHKYHEVFKDFGLEEYALDYSTLTEELVWKKFKELENKADIVRGKINKNFPSVKNRAFKFYDELGYLM
jgi:polysaccharide pyruvyl transferase WcaK-like protein